jgi:hypothetical protein
MGVLLGLNAIFWLAGFVLPVPCFVLASVGWAKTRNISPVKSRRQTMSQIALSLFTVGLAFWTYALLRQWRGADLYGTYTANLGALGSALLIVPSALAESGVRLWLILGAVGLLFFFGVSTGEIAI